MIFSVWQHGARAHDGLMRAGPRTVRCALGKNGIVADGREGDGATPAGTYLLRHVLYRADRGGRPTTALKASPIGPRDGWCDDPDSQAYNRPIRFPFPRSAEHLTRRDRLYDRIVVLGHNDNPVVPGLGSAIFMHVARADYRATLGCVALAPDDLTYVLKLAHPHSRLHIMETPR